METNKQSAVSEIVSHVRVLQDCPIRSTVLQPADLRCWYYYEKYDETLGITKLGIGIYLPLALELGITELVSIRDDDRDWRFTSPAILDGKMSLATDGEHSTNHGFDLTPDDVNFIMGHHDFEGDLDIEALDVQVFTEERAAIFYARVYDILEEMGEIDESAVLDSYTDNEEGLDRAGMVKAYRATIKEFSESGRLTEDELEERRIKRAYNRLMNQSSAVTNLGQDAQLVEAISSQIPNFSYETLRQLEFYNLITDKGSPVDWGEFLVPVTKCHPIWDKVCDRPVMHFRTFYACREGFEDQVAKQFHVKFPMHQLFIPRYGMVLNPETMKQELRVIDFNIRNCNTQENEIRYREWYPYENIRTKRSEHFKAYDSLRPLVVYPGRLVSDEYVNHYTDESRRGLSGDTRYDGRVVVKEGEINSMTFAMLNPDALVVSVGTSKIPHVQLIKIYNNFAPTCMMEVKFDDYAKSDQAAKSLRLEREDSIKGIGDHAYEAWNATIPGEFQEKDYDYEDMVAYIATSNPRWLRDLVSYATAHDIDDVHWSDFLKGVAGRGGKVQIDVVDQTPSSIDYRSHLIPDKVSERLATDRPEWVELYVDILRKGLSFEDTLLSDEDDRKIEDLGHEIFESHLPSSVVNERERLLNDVDTLMTETKVTISKGEDESDNNESTKAQIIRYVTGTEADEHPRLNKLYENDDFRFLTRIKGMDDLGEERYKELKQKEATWIDLSQSQMDRLTQKVSTTLGYNPAQQIIRELGFDLDAKPEELPMAQEVRHVALALGASGGKSTGFRAALIEYYEQICDRVEGLKLERLRNLLEDMMNASAMHPMMQKPLIKLMGLKRDQIDKSNRIREYYRHYHALPPEVQVGVDGVQDTIIARLKNLTGMSDIMVTEDDQSLLKWLEIKAPGSDMAAFLREAPDMYAEVMDAASRVSDGTEAHFETIWKIYVKSCNLVPQGCASDFKAHNKEGVPRLHRDIPPMIAMESFISIREDIFKLSELLNYDIACEVSDWMNEVVSLYDKVSSLTMIVACPSQIEVDKYYATLGNIFGIDNSFLRRLHADSYHGSTLGSDDEALVRCPVALVTHKRLDRPNRITKFLDSRGQLIDRKLIVVDESFSTREPFLVSESLLRKLNDTILEGALTRWCITDEELSETSELARQCTEAWIDGGKLTPETRGIYQELLRLYYPTRKMSGNSHVLEEEFASMTETERFAIVDSVDVIVHGLTSNVRQFLISDKLTEYLEGDKSREEDARTADEAEEARYETSEVINYLKSMLDYYNEYQLSKVTHTSFGENPSWSLAEDEQRVVYNWWYDQSLRMELSSDKVLPLVNPLSRSFRNTSVVLLDATSYDTLTNESAEGILEYWKLRLLAVSSQDGSEATDKLADEQRKLLDDALLANQIMRATYKRLCDSLLTGNLITSKSFEEVNVRDKPDPWTKSDKLAPFIHNGGWLGYCNSPSNLFDLRWTVLKIPGPPIVLDSVSSINLPIEKVSRESTMKVHLGDEQITVPRGMTSRETLSTILETLRGDYSQEFIRKILSSTVNVQKILDDVATLNCIITTTEGLSAKVGTIYLPTSWDSHINICPSFEGDHRMYDSWLENTYKLELNKAGVGYTTTPVIVNTEETDDDGNVQSVPQLVGIIVQFNDGLTIRRSEYWWDSVVGRNRVDHKMKHVVRLLEEWDTPERRLRLTTVMTTLSLDCVASQIVEYLIQADKLEYSIESPDEPINVPRALNVFTWRSVNHVYAGLLGEKSFEYFPPMRDAIDYIYDSHRALISTMEELGNPIPADQVNMLLSQAENVRAGMIRKMTTESDYNTVVKSEIKPLPECIYNRVSRMVTQMYTDDSSNERLKALFTDLDSYLMITHHNSTECKATSDYQHATGTMIMGMHMLPKFVIDEQQVDLGLNFGNDGQSVALAIQELYRCRLRKGTIHNPKSIDLLLVNCPDQLIKDRVIAPNRGRTHHQHKSQNVIRSITEDLRKYLETTVSLGSMRAAQSVDSAADDGGVTAAIWLSLIEPEVLDRLASKLPMTVVSTSGDPLLTDLVAKATPYLRTLGMELYEERDQFSSSAFSTRRSNKVISDNIEIFMADVYVTIQNIIKLGSDLDSVLPDYNRVVERIPALAQLYK